MVPQTFEQWKSCIENDCKISLTKHFAHQRLNVYKDKQNLETKTFIALYGEQHLLDVIHWFEKIIND